MVGRCISFWDGLFSEAICDFQDVHWHKKCMYIPMYKIYIRHPHAQNSLIGHRTSFSNDCLSTNFCLLAGYQAKCIFIDLGAADGNTFAKFIENLGLVLSHWKGVG